MPPSLTQRAFVLRALDYKEADRLVSYWTPEQGRLDAVVAGAKRHGSKLAGAAQPLQVCDVHYLAGKSSLVKVVQYHGVQSFWGVHANLCSLSAGLALAELIYHQSEALEEQARELYSLLLESFTLLDTLGQQADTEEPAITVWLVGCLLRVFLMLGLMPDWLPESQLSGREVEEAYTTLPFVVSLGGVIHPDELDQLEPSARQQLIRVSRPTITWLAQAVETLDHPLEDWLNETQAQASPDTQQRALRLLFHLVKEALHRPLQGEALFWQSMG